VSVAGCDVEEIQDKRNRMGWFGFLISGYEGATRQPAKIVPAKLDPSQYDVIIVGTPIWAGAMSSPLRAYLMKERARLPQLAFLCTCGSSGTAAYTELQNDIGKKPLGLLELKMEQVLNQDITPSVKDFIDKLTRART